MSMLYFSMDDAEPIHDNECGYEEEKEITWADIIRLVASEPISEPLSEPVSEPLSEPVSESEYNFQDKETYSYDTIQSMIEQTNTQINDRITRLQSLANYTNICYANATDKTPFGPDTLFQIKWCRDYHIQSLSGAPMSEASLKTYQEYSGCVKTVFRALLAAYKIRNQDEYADMAENGIDIVRHLYNIPPPKDYETWFKDQTYYELIEHLYYRTLCARDEEEYDAFQ